MRFRIGFLIVFGSLLLALMPSAWGQGSLPPSGLVYLQTIPIPGWKATGAAGNANVDLMGYNPVTRMMYLSDRTNAGVDVIDTRTNQVVGLVQVPGIPRTPPCPPPSSGCPNGVLVAIDLQQLVVTDGEQSVYVWDLRAPQTQPDVYTFPASLGTVTDGIAYNPINQTVYVVTDNPPEYLIGINLLQKKIVSQTAIPVSADLIAFNPVDGKIYISTEDGDPAPPNTNANAGIYSFDPVAGTISLVSKVGPPCPGHGIDIDPIANVAVMGCFGGTGDTGDVMVNLTTGTILKTFTDVGGTDAVVFNPNLRRFYASGALGTATTSGCPKGTGPFTPILGVVDATGPGSNPARLDGAACIGGGHIVGVDPITNFVYVPVSQYPTDPTSATTGQNGVMVLWDSSPLTQNTVTTASATLASIGAGTAKATVQMQSYGRRFHLYAAPTGISGRTAWLVIQTTVGNEVVQCAVSSSTGTGGCGEDLVGEPLIGAPVTLSVDGVAAARGAITLIK
jgi:hypothetical protein